MWLCVWIYLTTFAFDVEVGERDAHGLGVCVGRCEHRSVGSRTRRTEAIHSR